MAIILYYHYKHEHSQLYSAESFLLRSVYLQLFNHAQNKMVQFNQRTERLINFIQLNPSKVACFYFEKKKSACYSLAVERSCRLNKSFHNPNDSYMSNVSYRSKKFPANSIQQLYRLILPNYSLEMMMFYLQKTKMKKTAHKEIILENV